MSDILKELFPESFSSETGIVHDDKSSPTNVYPDLIFLIDQYLMEQSEDDSYGGAIMDGFHASDIASRNCTNAIVLARPTKRERKFPPKTLRIFDNGNAVHDRIQRYLAKNSVGTWKCRQCGAELGQRDTYVDWLHENQSNPDFPDITKQLGRVVSVSKTPIPEPEICPRCGGKHFQYAEWRIISDQYGVTGKIDGVISLPNFPLTGVEIKSCNVFDFGKMVKGENQQLIDKYIRQFNIYLVCEGLTQGVIIVENKNNQELFAISVKADPEPLQQIEYANKCYLGLEPMPEPILKDECGGCEFAGDKCHPRRPITSY
jgi:hypothetical protein